MAEPLGRWLDRVRWDDQQEDPSPYLEATRSYFADFPWSGETANGPEPGKNDVDVGPTERSLLPLRRSTDGS